MHTTLFRHLRADWVAKKIVAHPWLIFSLVLSVGVISAFIVVTQLAFDTRFAALLPEDSEVLKEVRAVQKRAGGTVEMVIAVSGGTEKKRIAFGRSMVTALEGEPWIRLANAEWPVDFFLDRRLLLLSKKELSEVRDQIDEEIERAKAKAHPMYVDLEDDEEQRPRAWARLDKTDPRLPKRTFTDPDGRYLFIRIKPVGGSSNMAEGKKILAKIKATVARVGPDRHGVKVGYAGGLVVNQEQHSRMGKDLRRAAVVAMVLVLLLLTLHIRRGRAPLILALPLIIGVTITLAITALTVGQLNLISGFLVSALIGIGIDFEIHLYTRFLERLALDGDRRAAMRHAIASTLPPCLTSAATTAAAFFAMTVSDFRGFREYGQIAGIGVLVTLAITFLALPPFVLLIGSRGKRPKPIKLHTGFHPRLAWSMVIVGLGLLVYSVIEGRHVAWHNDFRQLRGISETVKFSDWVTSHLGGSLSPAAILVRNLDEARRVERYLESQTKKPGSGVKRYLSMASMVPRDLADKAPILKQIEGSLREALKAELKPEDRKKVEEGIALATAKPWTEHEIPEAFRRRFATVDGQGQFVIVWARSEMVIDREIIAWGDELQRIRADLVASGLPVMIMDENRLAANVLKKMRAHGPIVVLAGAIAVVLILLIDFRNFWQVFRVAGSLALGIGWLAGMMRATGVDVNVFNLAVIPTIIGIGIDNAVHIQHRYNDEGPGSLPIVVATTGSAALLATLTSAIGFGATIMAHHMGIRSLGWLTLMGLSCAFVASTIFFPSLLRLLERWRGVKQGP